MFQNKIWVVDEAKLYPKLIKAISEGKAVIHDGVAYWAEGSGQTGVIQHLPFKETVVQNVEEALKMAQATTVIATAVSTGIILAAIVVQTRYLAAKLDKIQETVDVIAKDIHAQNIIFYMDKIAEYVGNVEVARSLLKDRSLAEEIHELAYPLLTTLASKRNQVMSFVDNILSLAKTSPDVSPRHYELIVNFAQMMLDIMPVGIHIEYLLTSRIGKPRLAEHLLLDGAEQFNGALGVYKNFMNELHRDLVKGQIGNRKSVYQAIESRAMQLIKSEENKILLSLPTGRVAPNLLPG
ncbi:MAG: hypothetical protein M0R47_01195 [Methylobacter sp.]|uniref:hypothetical protein n=1 Tax=Methylobacter sp. TaxID=2051955 RepID=UPI0025D3BC3F|nr:hypothetical protein [Methylobacter sp.]MCK9619130.1 hypothetical protein [Methylobacter sp.]